MKQTKGLTTTENKSDMCVWVRGLVWPHMLFDLFIPFFYVHECLCWIFHLQGGWVGKSSLPGGLTRPPDPRAWGTKVSNANSKRCYRLPNSVKRQKEWRPNLKLKLWIFKSFCVACFLRCFLIFVFMSGDRVLFTRRSKCGRAGTVQVGRSGPEFNKVEAKRGP